MTRSFDMPPGAATPQSESSQPESSTTLASLWAAAVAAGRPAGEALRELLTPLGQEHLVAFWQQLNAAQRDRLAAQITAIDFGLLTRLRANAAAEHDWAALADRALPPPAVRLAEQQGETLQQATMRGREALAAGRVGVVLVAGGQGTRLGFEHPKGIYPIGPLSGATLFQILFEKVLATSRRYGAPVPLYLMTSQATDAETRDYLAANNYFGLPPDQVTIFCQGAMPAIDAVSGRVLLAAPDEVFLSPDGHGGMLAALQASGAWQDIQRRGIEQLFYMQVDNPLVKTCDPAFLGYHLLAESELSTQVIAKRGAMERVGNVVSIDGQVQIIEYSDLPAEAAERRADDGSLLLWAGNTAIHVMSVAMLERAAATAALPLHRAHKAVAYVEPTTGTLVEPSEPNALKFERFIFDLLPLAQRAMVFEVEAASSFAPVKNAPGQKSDTPELAQQQMLALWREWLTAAGAALPGVAGGEGVPVEISPLVALDAQQLAERLAAGTSFSEATYLSE